MSERSFHTEIMDLTGKKYVRTYKNTILIVEYRKFDRFYILLSLREPGRPCIIGFVKILNRKSPATQTEPQTAADGGAFGGDAVKQVGRTDYPMFGQKLLELIDTAAALTGAKIVVYDNSGFLRLERLFGRCGYEMCTHTCEYCRSMIEGPGGRVACVENHFGSPKRMFDQNSYLRPVWVRCYAGLDEYVVPMTYNGRLVALMYIGQFRLNDEIPAESDLPISTDRTRQKELYMKLPLVDKTRIEQTAMLFEYAMNAVLLEYVPKNELDMFFLHKDSSIVEQVMSIFDKNFDQGVTVKEISESLHVDATLLRRKFKQELGISLPDFLRERRYGLAKRLVREGKQSLESIALNCGFKDVSAFMHWFKHGTEKTVSEFKADAGASEGAERGFDYARAARQRIESNWRKGVTASTIAKELGVTLDHLTRLFKAETGCTVYGYLQSVRMEHAKEALALTDTPVAQIAADNGFPTPSAFAATFSREMGMTPLEYRRSRKKRDVNCDANV